MRAVRVFRTSRGWQSAAETLQAKGSMMRIAPIGNVGNCTAVVEARRAPRYREGE